MRESVMDQERGSESARDISARSTAGFSATALRLTAAALALADGPIAEFADPIDYFADVIEYEVRDDLAVLRLRVAIKQVALFGDVDRLLGRLEGVEAAPWPQIRAAMEEAQQWR